MGNPSFHRSAKHPTFIGLLSIDVVQIYLHNASLPQSIAEVPPLDLRSFLRKAFSGDIFDLKTAKILSDPALVVTFDLNGGFS